MIVLLGHAAEQTYNSIVYRRLADRQFSTRVGLNLMGVHADAGFSRRRQE